MVYRQLLMTAAMTLMLSPPIFGTCSEPSVSGAITQYLSCGVARLHIDYTVTNIIGGSINLESCRPGFPKCYSHILEAGNGTGSYDLLNSKNDVVGLPYWQYVEDGFLRITAKIECQDEPGAPFRDITSAPSIVALPPFTNCGIPPTQTDLQLTAVVTTDELPVVQRKPSNTVTKIVVPLGGEFRVGLERGSGLVGAPLLTGFSLTTQTPTTPIATKALFKTKVLIDYQPNVDDSSKVFQAVHRGTAQLRLTPRDKPAQQFTVEVDVVDPLHFGSNQRDWTVDPDVTLVAHRTGTLPQMLKAQMEQESATGVITDGLAWRYEPARDLDTVQGQRSVDPYVHFTAPDPRGDQVSAEDLSPRESLSMLDSTVVPAVVRSITANDVNVTIAQIYDASNCRARRANGQCIGQRWASPGGPRDQLLSASDVVAQTPTASSYGYLQTMYYLAIELQWNGLNGAKNPDYLFDKRQHILDETSSLWVGSQYNVRNWRDLFGSYGDAMSFSGPDVLETSLGRMYHRYNSRWRSAAGAVPYYPNYESAIIDKAKHFLPVRSGDVLQ